MSDSRGVPKKGEPRPGPEAELQAISRRLSDLARRVLLSRPHAHDLVRSIPDLHLDLTVDFTGRDGAHAERGRLLHGAIVRHVDDAILSHAAFRPGRVYCFYCESAVCDHSGPRDPRQVFDRYGETGQPEWRSLLDQAISRGLDAVDGLARERGSLASIVSDRPTLVGDRLDVFSRGDRAYDLRGQLALGYYSQELGGAPRKFAVTLQVIRSATRSGVVRLGVNAIGLLPDGTGAESMLDGPRRFGFIGLIQEAGRELATLNQALKRVPNRDRMSRAARWADELLGDMAHGFGRKVRRESWRTDHASERAEEGTRPTGMAQGDLERLRPDRAFFDEQDRTCVVLGARGRTHVFSLEGLHVTSLRLERREIRARIDQKRWRPLERVELDGLLAKVRPRATPE